MPRRTVGIVTAIAYIGTVWFANYLIQHYGAVSVGFGLVAPAGVFAAGLALTLRDVTQVILGRIAVVGCILAGAALSWTISPTFAVASAVAFLASETADFAVYTPLEERGFLKAMVASNLVGLVVDSLLFLWLAFHSLAYLNGQIVGKAEMTALALLVLIPVRRQLREATA